LFPRSRILFSNWVLALIIIVVALFTMLYVLRFGFSNPIIVQNQGSADYLKALWFTPNGNLVALKQQRDTVIIEPWVGSQPTTGIYVHLRELEEQSLTLLNVSSIELSFNDDFRIQHDFVVAPNLSKIFYQWKNYLVAYDLGSRKISYSKIDKQVITDPRTSNTDSYPKVAALAVTDQGLAVLRTNGLLELRDFEKLEVISTVDHLQGTDMVASGPFVAILSSSGVAICDTRSFTLKSIPVESRQAIFEVSSSGRLAIAQGAVISVIDPPLRIPYDAPSKVSAIEFYQEDKLLAGGDFENIYLLSPNGGPQLSVKTPSGVRSIAKHGDSLAYANENNIVLLSTNNKTTLTKRGIQVIVGSVLYLVVIVALRQFWMRREFERYVRRSVKSVNTELSATSSESPSVASDGKTEAVSIPLPPPPSELIDACAAGQCVLYGGAGISAQAGLPTWQEFLRGLVNWAEDRGFIDQSRTKSFLASIELGRPDSVADSVYHELAIENRLPALYDYLHEIFQREMPLPNVHQVLPSLQLAAVLTTNFDDLFERTYHDKKAQVLTPRDAEQLKTSLSRYEFFILKLYGTLSQSETVMVAPAQYEDAVIGNRSFSDFMETLFFSRTLLFVGASLDGIEAYLKGITLPKTIPRTHYALVAVEGTAWQSQADVLKRRYGIEVLPYTPTAGFPELKEFLEELADQLSAKPALAQENERSRARLKRLTLKDVGPFEHLDLEFDPKWNILLGDNGVGKSTILKAIAVAICGRDAQPYALPLIKSGKDSALIVLETDRNTVYETQIHNRSGVIDIVSKPSRPLEIENWLALGFSPLRTASWERPTSPEAEPRRKQALSPTVEDLMPLIKGGLDPRVDKLKNWLVNLDYWKSKAVNRGSDNAAQYDALIQEFFYLVDYLTIDLKLSYGGIDETYGIQVETNDGKIPIESVSQGTTSLTAWVGILLQRLNEVYGHDNDPKSKYALVLMDEIDAHMHPAWQQALIQRLGDQFNNLQLIATTHSPLMIGGMRPRQLFRFYRDANGKISRLEIDREMALGRADQLLTGELFGLETTVDPDTQAHIGEYQQLLGIDPESRTNTQQLKLHRLQQILGMRIPETGETVPERRAQEFLQALLAEQFEGKFPEVQKRLLDRAQKLMDALKKQGEANDDSYRF
jgi:hypothetical protein